MKLQIFNNGWQDVQGVRINTLQDEITKDESYDNATIEARNIDAKPCERWSKFRTVEDDGEIRYYYGSDTVTRLQMSKWYVHKFELVEPTKFLERFFLSGLSVTQSNPDILRSLIYAIDKALSDINEKYGTNFYVNADIYSKLNKITCPEYVVTAKTTFFEFLTNYIGKKINAMPRLLGDSNGFFNEITFDYFAEIYPAISPNVTGVEISKPQESSATFLEAEVSNMIAENEDNTSAISYPFINGFISVRSDDIRLTDTNAKLSLPYGIKEVLSLNIKLNGKGVVTGFGEYEEHNDIVGIYDAIDYIVTKPEWDALPESSGFGLDKRSTLYYTVGSSDIENIAGTYKEFWTSTYILEDIVKTILKNQEKIYYIKNGIQYEASPSDVGIFISDSFRLQSVSFNIKYIPYNEKIITTQVNPRNKSLGSLTYNQSAENTNSDEFGKAMWNELQNTNTEIKQMTARVSDKTEIKRIGDIIDGRIITSVKRRFKGVKWIDLLYTANEDFIRRSQYIEENREYRPYAIPQETIVDRHLHTDEFCYIDYEVPTGYKSSNFIWGKSYSLPFDEYDQPLNITTAILKPYGNGLTHKVAISTTSVALGNSVQFNWKMEDNFSAGKYLTDTDSKTPTTTMVQYVDEYGNLDSFDLTLLAKIIGDIDPNTYPIADSVDTEQNPYYKKTYENLQKDAGERLMGSIQLHFVTKNSNITISSNIAKYSPLVAQKSIGLKFIVTNYEINKYTNNLPENIYFEEKPVTYHPTNDKDYCYINTNLQNTGTFGYKYWALIDKNKNLFVGGKTNDLARFGAIYLTFTSRLL